MADWIIVVDDDVINLKMAGHILSKNHMRVTALKSGQALLDYVKEHGYPDLILLDIKMPEMDGFQTLIKLRQQEPAQEKTPVIFLTASEDQEAETNGLALGTMDFIKKPFVPEVLTLRVRHMIELIRLQRNLSLEVEKRPGKMKNYLFMSYALWRRPLMPKIPIPMDIPAVWQNIQRKLLNDMGTQRRDRVIFT